MESLWKQAISHWKQLWETWDLRVFVLFSFFLQTVLIFSAPLRKRTASSYIIMPMWLAYLLADATANFAVGLIAKSQGDTSTGPFANPELVAFWAPFLLVHLGGPDTITAFALEDNQLWLRHLLQLVFQCGITTYIFILTLSKNKLWIPTLLMFVVGFVKYTERTRCLYLASSSKFQDSLLTEPDPGPNYAKLVDEWSSNVEARIPSRIEMIPEPNRIIVTDNPGILMPMGDLEVVQQAHHFFETFKGLIADFTFSFRERDQSRTFFLKRTARDSFKVVEVELNFLYDVLYTKSRVVQGNYGYPLRFVSFALNIAALVLFYLVDKQEFRQFDVGITCTLLLGAIALDLIAFFMVLFSDWTAVALSKSYNPSIFIRILGKFLNINRERWPKDSTQHRACSFGWFMQIVCRKWSESLSQYNLIDYCLHPRSEWWEKFIGFFSLTAMLDGLKYVKTVKFTNDLRDLVFEELRMKSVIADDFKTAQEIYSARGDLVLLFEGCTEMLPWIKEVDFDESFLLWHIATDLCFHTSKVRTDANPESGNAKNKDFRGLSKLLSDYMLYLMVMEPTMMSASRAGGLWKIRLMDTCAEVKRFFRETIIGEEEEEKTWYSNRTGWDEVHKRACDCILAVSTAVKPVAVKGDRSKSVLFDACILAKELENLGEEKKWEIMSKVWVEMLSYAACRCSGSTHAAQLSKGGHLITLVWLLMAHLGLGNQFQAVQGTARAKVFGGK